MHVASIRRIRRLYSVQRSIFMRRWISLYRKQNEVVFVHGVDSCGKMLSDNYFLGRVHAPNSTSAEGSMAKDFSKSDWIRIVRHAVRRDGLPAQEKFRYNFSVRELGELIAYRKTLPPVDRASHPNPTKIYLDWEAIRMKREWYSFVVSSVGMKNQNACRA